MVRAGRVERREDGDGLAVQQLPEHLDAALPHRPRHLQLRDPVRVHHPLDEDGGDLVDAGHAVQQRGVRHAPAAAVGDERADEMGAARLEAVQEGRDRHPLAGPVRAEPLRRGQHLLARRALLQRGEHAPHERAGVPPGLLLGQRRHQLRPAPGGVDRRLQQHRVVAVLDQQPQEPVACAGLHPLFCPPVVRPGQPSGRTLDRPDLAGAPGSGVR
ncbi:hypothetical protein [Actinomadura madurae]|uniref:hypothetical protein n=1 Tax=Actinomadura madurae TaxID=1993 RepID=UPI0020D24C1A|nr:hypothetical protein [Actinomadura madurae]MCQ0012584.1 hypothetical protein [Actinomadura madurae]